MNINQDPDNQSASPSASHSRSLTGQLYIVATPIGNLGDISCRALDVLAQVDFVAAEDTRHSAKLLKHFNITTRLIAYHDHSDDKRQQQLLNYMLAGKSIALISDAGTPLISDPGYSLLRQAREHSIEVCAVPGPCALVAALSVAGLPSDRFVFLGFLPAKTQARVKRLQSLQQDVSTLIFYESSHRIAASLEDMVQVFGADREAVLCRELTKTYETHLSGSLAELAAKVLAEPNQRRGEFVVLVAGYKDKEKGSVSTDQLSEDQKKIMRVLLEELSVKQAAAIGAKLTQVKKRELYQWAIDSLPPKPV